MKSRGYIVTINNYDDEDYIGFTALYEDGHARYIILAFEVGPECGTPHIQGYIYFNNPRSRLAVSKIIPRASLEIARATGEKAFRRADYCRKDGDFIEFGIEPTPGRIGKEYLEEVMADPYAHLQAANQYRRFYREMKNKFDVKQQREVFYVKDLESIIDSLNPLDTYISHLNDDYKTYDSEKTMVIYQSQTKIYVPNWLKGFPTKICRGYEVIIIDPKIMYIIEDYKK